MKISQLQYSFHLALLAWFRYQIQAKIARYGLLSLSIILLILSSQVQAKQTLLVLGDSLSAAYGMSQEQGWVSLLANKPEMKGIAVINASISGETSSGGLQRLPKLIKRFQPSWLILELGINDAFRGQNLKHTQQNLQKMINLCLNQQCQVLLLGNRLPTNYGPAYDRVFRKMYQQLAEQNQLLFDPFFIESVIFNPTLIQQDGIHPKANAQQLILQQIWPLIKKLTAQTTIPAP